MPTYPRGRAEFLVWAESHVPIWGAQLAAIGIDAEQLGEFAGAVADLRTKTTAQQTAFDAAKAATEAVQDADRDAKRITSNLVRSIRAFATNEDDPTVYQLAQIPAPSDGSPVPPPGRPMDFSVGLESTGAITLSWKAKHPEGSGSVVYAIERKLINENTFDLVGVSGDRRFTDDTLPFGVDGATYLITSQRGSVKGQPSQQLVVTFGSQGNQSASNGLSFSTQPVPAKAA